MKFVSILIAYFLLALSVLGAEYHIKDADDFIEFANNVNSGISKFSGTTVYLDADIDFSEKIFEPVGKDMTNFFQGTFDGQGFTISNLKMDPNSGYAELFGYSDGLTIKNVVIGDTCSFGGSYPSSTIDLVVGGIINTMCEAKNGKCVIENTVNMGNIAISGDFDEATVYLGGLAGFYTSSSYTSTIKNCANYGSVSISGNIGKSVIGSIVSAFYGSSSEYVYIQDCINYGAITYSGSKDEPTIGGIVGYSQYANIESCVSVGKITNSESDIYVGSIVGESRYYGSIEDCFCIENVGYSKSYGYSSGSISSNRFKSTNYIDDSLLQDLNSCSSTHWAMLHMRGGRINNINQDFLVINNKHFPDPEKESTSFLGWFTDSELTEKYDPKEVTTIIDVYAKYSEDKKKSFSFSTTPISLIFSILFYF